MTNPSVSIISTDLVLLDVDASSKDWVYFTSDEHLYRWRKPAVAYSQSMP